MHVYNPAHLLGGKLRLKYASEIGTELHHLFVYLIAVYGGKIPADVSEHPALRSFTTKNCRHLYLTHDENHVKVRAGTVVVAWLEKGINIGRLGNWSLAKLPEAANFRGDGGRFTSDIAQLFRSLWLMIHAANRAAQVVVASHDFGWDHLNDRPELVRDVDVVSLDIKKLVDTAFNNHHVLPIESQRLAARMSQFLCKVGNYETALRLDKFYDAFARKEVSRESVVGIPWQVARCCR